MIIKPEARLVSCDKLVLIVTFLFICDFNSLFKIVMSRMTLIKQVLNPSAGLWKLLTSIV